MSISEELGQVSGVGPWGFNTVMTTLGVPEPLVHEVVPLIADDARVYPVPLTRQVLFARPWAPKVPLEGLPRTRQVLFVFEKDAAEWFIIRRLDWYQIIGNAMHGLSSVKHLLVEYVPALALQYQIPYAGEFIGARPCLYIIYDPSEF